MATSTAPPPSSDQVYDLLAVGFGPASLAIAIALAEHNASAPSPFPQPQYSSLGGLQDALGFTPRRQDGGASEAAARRRREVKACFLEKHERFRWHPGMMIEGSSMQISFLKDLATLRNPQSAYTFLSYLASSTPSRLASFISLSTFTPSRREFADYLQWCAEKVQKETEQQGGEVNYGEEVVSVEALEGEEGAAAGASDEVSILKVTSRRIETGELVSRLTRNLVVSTGGQPRLPPQLAAPELHASGRVFHTASFVEKAPAVLSSIVSSVPTSRPIRLAVVGAGQSAAECFLALRSRLASLLLDGVEHRPQVDMLFRSSSLRPTDEGSFSNEVFDPAISQAMYRLSEEHRQRVLQEAKSTNYSIVNPKKLEELYETMYAQKVEEDIAARSFISASDLKRDPKLTLKPFTELVRAELSPSSSSSASTPTVTLTLHNPILGETNDVEYDLVVCGTGYDRQAWRHLLFPPAPSPTSSPIPAESSSAPAVPLSALFAHPEPETPPYYSPPHLDLPETAFTSRRSSLDTAADGRGTSRSQSSSVAPSARDSSLASSRAPTSTAASSPPTPSSPSKASPAKDAQADQYKVAENYRLELPRKTRDGRAFRPTVWLQGSCEKTHGISDSLLSVLAVRSGEVVQSLLREGFFGESEGQEQQA
ncbi:hypothetical protein JCM8097_002760 [Rhodosporidiobolus ruineniae]